MHITLIDYIDDSSLTVLTIVQYKVRTIYIPLLPVFRH